MITGINRFLALRELKVQGVRVPHYNRHADLVCFVNDLPLLFIELKAIYKNIGARTRWWRARSSPTSASRRPQSRPARPRPRPRPSGRSPS